MPTFTTAKAPGALPVLGHAPQLLHRPLPFLASLPRHGDLIEVALGPRTAYVPCHPEVFRLVCRNDHVYDKGGPYYDRTREIIGNGLATASCAAHRRQRRIVQPSFDHRRVGDYLPVMNEEALAATASWRPGETVDVNRAMEALALRVTMRTLFGISPGHRAVAEVERSLPVLVAGVYRRVLVPEWTLSLLPTRLNRDYGPARARLWRITRELIDEARQRDLSHHRDLLSVLLRTHDADTGEPLPEQEVFDQIITLLVSGMETSARALGFTLHLISRHPETADALHAEATDVLAGRPAGPQDVSRLSYTRQVVLESLRLYPPVWMVSRVTTAETELAGRHLPTGTNLLLSPYALHHNPRLFPDPKAFDPDRWLAQRARETPPGALAPFGLGNRRCVGDQFALVELVITVATVASRWRLRPVPGRRMRPQPRATLSTGPLPLTPLPVRSS